jgi:hypothetical protein
MPGGQPLMSPTPAPNPTPGPVGPMTTDAMGLPSYAPGGMGGCGFGCGNPPLANGGCGWDGCGPCNGCQWYASVLGLAMTRDKPNKLWVSYQGSNEAVQIMNTQDADVGWEGGGEVTFGRYFCCNQWSLEATFWTMAEFTGCASVSLPSDPAGVSTPLNARFLIFDGQQGVGWFNNSLCQTLQRTDEVHDIEINAIRHHLLCEGGCPLCVDLLAGVRFFRFRDDLDWGAQDSWVGQYYGTWAYFRDQTENNLFGGQIGFNVNYQLCNRLRFFVKPTVGLFDNYINNYCNADMIDATGTRYIATSSLYPNMTYPVQSHCNQLSVLTQIDVGLDWQITQNLSARFGYRLVAATGIGLADNQIPPYLYDVPAIQDIDRNGNLLLHGAFAGVTYCF